MTKVDQTIFDIFVHERDAKPLPPGYRWLTTDDVWQIGDEYNAHGDDWWVIGGPHTGGPGGPVRAEMLCYTPRGKR